MDGSSLRSLRFWTLMSTLLLLVTRAVLCLLVFRLSRMRLHSPPDEEAREHLNRYFDAGLAVYKEPSFSESSILPPPAITDPGPRNSYYAHDSVYQKR